MKILLTGGSGMVGTNILAHPLALGLDIYSPGRNELDLRDKVAVCRYLELLAPDLIIHAAGRVGGIKANMTFPYEFLLENLEVGTNVIASAADVGIPRLLNLGSSCIYPKDMDGMLTEDMILGGRLEPTNEGYALAKIAAMRLCEYAASRTDSLQYKTLIPCNLYGPHDKFDLASAHLIPAIIAKVHGAKVRCEPTVEIWGDGSARREFMYVEDLAAVVLRAARNYERVPSVMNVGLGHDHAVLDYYRIVAEVAGWRGEFTFDLTKPTGMKRKLMNVDRQTAWGFQPGNTLSDGIRKTYDFYLRTSTP
jgi:GDP-L-fucose synthase